MPALRQIAFRRAGSEQQRSHPPPVAADQFGVVERGERGEQAFLRGAVVPVAGLLQDREWNEGQAKKRLLAAFATLDDAELVGRYRRKMASLLF